MATTVNSEKLARDIIVIGASAGGIQAVRALLGELPADLPAALCIVIHRGAASQANWADMLGIRSNLPVVEPRHQQPLDRGVVYIAPSDRHMTLVPGSICLDQSGKQHFTRPAIDPLFSTAARAYGARVVGVVLTGGGRDGMQGLLDITAAAGLSFVQQPAEAECAAMPEYSLAHDHVHAALTLSSLATVLPQLARASAVEV